MMDNWKISNRNLKDFKFFVHAWNKHGDIENEHPPVLVDPDLGPFQINGIKLSGDSVVWNEKSFDTNNRWQQQKETIFWPNGEFRKEKLDNLVKYWWVCLHAAQKKKKEKQDKKEVVSEKKTNFYGIYRGILISK